MLTPPDESDTETSIPGTEAFNGSSKAVRSSNQGKVSVDWDSPKTEKVDGICKHLSIKNEHVKIKVDARFCKGLSCFNITKMNLEKVRHKAE